MRVLIVFAAFSAIAAAQNLLSGLLSGQLGTKGITDIKEVGLHNLGTTGKTVGNEGALVNVGGLLDSVVGAKGVVGSVLGGTGNVLQTVLKELTNPKGLFGQLTSFLKEDIVRIFNAILVELAHVFSQLLKLLDKKGLYGLIAFLEKCSSGVAVAMSLARTELRHKQ
ncbi:hypothetical protein Bhyg_03527 [Pseudolycoriella hygida]|uniref:Uncharacterized protein n=1 Tax=Pseudolycoriella hygida TaxID=35572 RepID=A0A9Q0NDK7_9DIPT|nr:hypothetical protein Bhyg_03527 [Pseudolycoriella hygida]